MPYWCASKTRREPVLVVDDLPSNLDLLKRLLTAQGYRVLTAGDGVEALDGHGDARPRTSCSPTSACRSATGSISAAKLKAVAGHATDADRAHDGMPKNPTIGSERSKRVRTIC